MVPEAGLEPARCYHRGIFLPTTVFTAIQRYVCGLDHVFTFKFFKYRKT